MNVARLRVYAGLAAAVVPCAIIIHLVAEAAAVGHAGLGFPFLVRHAYFIVAFAAATWWFGATAGVGRSRAERRRRFGLLRADLRSKSGKLGLAALLGANLAFFAVTQGIEGVPIATAALVPSLGIALAGSVIATLVVWLLGHAIAVGAGQSVIGRTPRRPALRLRICPARRIAMPRRVQAVYTLLRPNRPPPFLSQL